MKKIPDINVKMALDEMQLEIANEVNFNLSNVGKIGGTMTKKLVEMGEKQLVKDTDTFNPS